ncbi:ArsR family transcriptional regulator [Streptomyces sp. SID1121]|uniref:ArsR family transcriptional regulator n=1 Tax=Streptomyces sp. SID1121 TaxID=3425888 RepID=UPI004056A7A0
MHFTAQDLARVHVAGGPDVMWEIVLSAAQLTGTAGQAVFGPWRVHARTRLRHLPASHRRLIRYLAPPVGDFPDFLTPPQATQSLPAGINAVLSLPSRRLRQDLAVLPHAPHWARPLADADPVALAELADALHGYHRAVLTPVWPRLRTAIDAERAARARVLLSHGIDGLLNSLRPTLRWSAPVLEADYPVDRDLHLAGRGLLLVPSVFCWRTPVTFIDPGLPPVLVYPLDLTPGWVSDPAALSGRASGTEDPLARLLGTSRAAALRLVEDGCTTGELARRAGLSQPSASQHTAVLREANLITSVRRGNEVIHTLTPLGTALLLANPSSAGPSRGTAKGAAALPDARRSGIAR